MTRRTKSLLGDALALPERDRAQLAGELLKSIPPPAIDLEDKDSIAELDRRYEECLRDPKKSKSWSAVYKRALKRIKRRKRASV